MFPETKGRTIEEMEAVFEQGHVFTAWQIPADVGRRTLEEVVGTTKADVSTFDTKYLVNLLTLYGSLLMKTRSSRLKNHLFSFHPSFDPCNCFTVVLLGITHGSELLIRSYLDVFRCPYPRIKWSY